MLNKNDSIRCYFMDEPIQTMDDLNILSFIDLLRFQLGEKTDKNIFIDQVFIATCDNDLEKLILHKMKSFGIGICEYKFEGPGKFNRSVFV
jgi:exonuclease SbcC